MIHLARRFLLSLISATTFVSLGDVARNAWADPANRSATTPANDPIINFRRVFVPADSPSDWPRGTTPYVPIRKDEFERLIVRARSVRHAVDRIDQPRIVRATYYGRYAAGRLVGSARLNVARDEKSSEFLPLVGLRTSIRDPRWFDDARRRAYLGTTADGSTWLRVEKSGQLRFDWEQRESTSMDQRSRFVFAWPRCPATSIVIDLPKRYRLECEQAIVRADLDETLSASSLPALSSGYQRWHVSLGSQHAGSLVVVAKDDPNSKQRANVSQHNQYQISPQGLLLVADLRIDARQPVDRLEVQLDRGLEPIYVRQQGQDIRWTRPADAKDASRLTIELPKAIVGEAHEIAIGAIGPITTGVRWQLPAVHVRDITWRQGQTSISVTSPLTVEKVATLGGQLTSPVSDGTIELRQYSQASKTELVVSRPEHRITATVGTTVDLASREISGRTTIALTVERSDAFEINAHVSPGWVIDSIESPGDPELVVDWPFVKSRDDREIRIALFKPVKVGDELRLVITGHRSWPADRTSMQVDELVMIEPSNTSRSDEFVLVRASSPFQLKLDGEDRLTPTDRFVPAVRRAELFDDVSSGLLIRRDSNADFLRVALGSRAPNYTASIDIHAVASGRWLTETFRVKVDPETMGSSPIEQVEVVLSCVDDESLQWSLVGQTDTTLDAKAGSISRNGGDADVDLSAWQISLPKPQSQPFQIVARRIREIVPEMPVSLAMVNGASSQSGIVHIESPERIVGIRNDGLMPTSRSGAENHRAAGVEATFRFNPPADVVQRDKPALALYWPDDESRPALAWVESLETTARFAPPDQVRYTATFLIKNHGRRTVSIACPSGTVLRSARVDGHDVARMVSYSSSGSSAERTIEFTLSPEQETVRARVDFSSTTVRENFWGRWAPVIDPLFPEIDLPVLDRRWSVWLPPTHRVMDRTQVGPVGGIAPWSIAQRLFGRLARTRYQSTFDPLDAAAWHSPLRGTQHAVQDQAAKLVERLSLVAIADHPEVANAWGTIARQWSAAIDETNIASSPESPRLWLDAPGLARAGITAGTRVFAGSRTKQVSQIDLPTLLEQRGLGILIHRNAIVLTSARRISLFRGQVTPCGPLPVFAVATSPLGDAVERAVTAAGGGWLLSAERWSDQMDVAANESLADGTFIEGEDLVSGWQLVRPNTVPGGTVAALRLVSKDYVAACAWFAFLIAAGCTWWKSMSMPRTSILSVAAVGICALLLPMGVSPVATAGFCGAVAGCLFRIVPQLARTAVTALPPANERPPQTAHTNVAATPVSATLTVALIAACLLAVLAARSLSDDTIESTRQSVDRVLIPIDETEKPTGEHYYVPRSLFDRLHQISQRDQRDTSIDWFVRSAAYRTELQLQPGSMRIAADRVVGQFVIEAMTGRVRVKLPLKRTEVGLVGDSVLVNDRSSRATWNQEGSALEFDLEEIGRYRVRLELQIKQSSDAKDRALMIEIPAAPDAQLEITRRPANATVAVETAAGRTDVRPDEPRADVNLGPVRALVIDVDRDGSSGTSPATFSVDQLAWMKVQPSNVLLETKFVVEVSKGELRSLSVSCDPRLILLGKSSAKSTVVPTGAPDRVTYRFRLSDTPTGKQTISARFLLKDTAAIGSLEIPKMEVLGARRSQRWFAVSVDPTHVPEEKSWTGLDPALTEFVRRWNAGAKEPTSERVFAAYRVSGPDTQWTIAIRPRPTTSEVDSQIDFVIDRRWVKTTLAASFVTQSGYHVQHILNVPAELKVDSVKRFKDGTATPIRWRRSGKQVTCLFDEPQRDSYSLRVEGRLPVRLGEELSLTDISFSDVESRSSTVRLYRHESVAVTDLTVDGLISDEATPHLSDTNRSERLLGTYRGSGKPLRITARCVANDTIANATTMVSPMPAGSHWHWEFAAQVDVTSGLLDRLTLELPENCVGPYKIVDATVDDRQAKVVIDVQRQRDRNRLVLRPDQAARKTWRFRVTGVLETDSDSIQSPQFEIPEVTKQRRLLRLDRRALQAAKWDAAKLRQVDNFPEWATLEADEPQIYEIGNRTTSAVIVASERQVVRPTILLADVTMTPQPDGACSGVATFDVVPAGDDSCELQIPGGFELVGVSVNGRPGATLAVERGVWQISFASDRLPQRIRVVISGNLPAPPSAESSVALAAPWLRSSGETMEAAYTLWTVASVPGLDSNTKSFDISRSTAAEADRIRAEAMVAVLQSARYENRTSDWTRTWVQRLVRYRTASSRTTDIAGEVPIDGEVTAWLTADGLLSFDSLSAPRYDTNPQQRPRAFVDADDVFAPPPSTWAYAGNLEQLRVNFSTQPSIDVPAYGAWAATLAMLAFAACLAIRPTEHSRRSVRARTLWMRGRYAIVAAAGLAWWLWLWPSFLGLLVIFGSVILAWRPVRPAAAPASPSTQGSTATHIN